MLVSTRVVVIRHRNVTGEFAHAIVSRALNRRLLVEALSDASGVAVRWPAGIEAAATPRSAMFSAVLADLRDVIVPRSTDPQVIARPNIGTVAGGAWIWDDTAHLRWEVLYKANYTALRLPRDQDLSDITLPTGVSIKAVEPTLGYDLGISDGTVCQAALQFQGVMPPRPLRKSGSPFGGANHFDQFGRVTGTVRLGERIVAIDCLGMRDRSWGPRPEHRPKRSAYVTGMATPREGFLAVTKWHGDVEEIAYGFMIRNGETADMVAGTRHVERDPAQGWVTRIVIEGDSNGLIEWTINGHVGHGEDQDMWPIHN